jgi:hypothetical protein|tara:strand:+ start:3207 stop:3527 length:321 start_codon:yes stop_codon:yes gene_type:complete
MATINELNAIKKWRNCLKCGKRMFSPKTQWICNKCHKNNDKKGSKERIKVTPPGKTSVARYQADTYQPLYDLVMDYTRKKYEVLGERIERIKESFTFTPALVYRRR